jgi:hypothetical protein
MERQRGEGYDEWKLAKRKICHERIGKPAPALYEPPPALRATSPASQGRIRGVRFMDRGVSRANDCAAQRTSGTGGEATRRTWQETSVAVRF